MTGRCILRISDSLSCSYPFGIFANCHLAQVRNFQGLVRHCVTTIMNHMPPKDSDAAGTGPAKKIQKARAESKSGCAAPASRGLCEHNRKKSRCRECGGGSFCEHNVQRYNCHKCINARFVASLVGNSHATSSGSETAKVLLLELQVNALTEQRDNMLKILAQNEAFAAQRTVLCTACMQLVQKPAL